MSEAFLRNKDFLKAFLQRIKNILIHSKNEWLVIKAEQTTYRNVLTGYLALIAAIPPVSAIAERLIFNSELSGTAVSARIGYLLTANILWYFMIIFNMIVTGAVVTAILGSNRSQWADLLGLKLAVYAFTPLFLVSILMIIPRQGWLIYVAMLYSIYLLYLGIICMTEISRKRAAWSAVACFAVAGLIIVVLNMFEYMLESYLMRTLISWNTG